MTKRTTRQSRNQAALSGDLNNMLDTLRACDWAVIEFSMGLFNVPQAEQAVIRAQNRRLHGALRKHLLPLESKATAIGRTGANSDHGRSTQASRMSRKACRSCEQIL